VRPARLPPRTWLTRGRNGSPERAFGAAASMCGSGPCRVASHGSRRSGLLRGSRLGYDSPVRAPSAVAPVALVLAALAACSGAPPRIEGPLRPPDELDAGLDAPALPDAPALYEDEAAPAGPACFAPGDCEAGTACRGPRGCGAAWACGAPLPCGEDRIAYCGCDGVTFYALSGCPGRPYEHPGACEERALAELDFGIHDFDEPPTTEDRLCTSSADCRRGEVCFGPSGCGVTLRCQRVRGCSGPRATFCGCDGESFEASAACPGRAYLFRGACDAALAVREADAGLDAGVRLTAASDAGSDAAVRLAGAGTDAGVRLASAADAGSDAPVAVASTAGRPDAGVRLASVADAGVRPASAPDAGVRLASVADAGPPATVDGRRICRSNRDCRRPDICAGPPGCGEIWTCTAPREVVAGGRCAADTQYFCDCERETFVASMTCPGRPYAHRGSCEIDLLLELAGGSTH
jgi:hypothetical protein